MIEVHATPKSNSNYVGNLSYEPKQEQTAELPSGYFQFYKKVLLLSSTNGKWGNSASSSLRCLLWGFPSTCGKPRVNYTHSDQSSSTPTQQPPGKHDGKKGEIPFPIDFSVRSGISMTSTQISRTDTLTEQPYGKPTDFTQIIIQSHMRC